jgi:hypothetical protein
MERWIGNCRRELLDRTLIWSQRHLLYALREFEQFYIAHRPRRARNLRPPDIDDITTAPVTDLATRLRGSRGFSFSLGRVVISTSGTNVGRSGA